MNWQPIETVPKDYTLFLSFIPSFPSSFYRAGNAVCLCKWTKFGFESHTPGGTTLEEPTHWMPLPEPPSK